MDTDQQETIKQYLQGLEKGNTAEIVRLFSANGVVYSPLYGKQPAPVFYKSLFKDTIRSTISLHHVFHEAANPEVAAAHFSYDWQMRDGSEHSFECVDVFHFDETGKIQEMRIIYDTWDTRRTFNELR
jgi:ketosteroid isomerase-like protein